MLIPLLIKNLKPLKRVLILDIVAAAEPRFLALRIGRKENKIRLLEKIIKKKCTC